MIELRGRYSKRVSAMLLILGASLLLYVGFVDPGGPFFALRAFLGVVACALGLRAFDRRVKLILGEEGLWYAPWGRQLLTWNEIESISAAPGFRLLVHHKTGDPEWIRRRMPALSRLNFAIDSVLGRGHLVIQVGALDATVDEIIWVAREYLNHPVA